MAGRRLAEFYNELFTHCFPPHSVLEQWDNRHLRNFAYLESVANTLKLDVKTKTETLVGVITSAMETIKKELSGDDISDFWQVKGDDTIHLDFSYDDLHWHLTLKKTGGRYGKKTYMTLTLPNDGFLYLREPLLDPHDVVVKSDEIDKFREVILCMTSTFLPDFELLPDNTTHRFDYEHEQFELTIEDVRNNRVFQLLMHNGYPREYSGSAWRKEEEPSRKIPGEFKEV
jgi:hypothetical protein